MDSFKDELALAAGKVTPGVDDAPYIQYALEALTRDRRGSSDNQVSGPLSTSQRQDVSRRPQGPDLMVTAIGAPAAGIRAESAVKHMGHQTSALVYDGSHQQAILHALSDPTAQRPGPSQTLEYPDLVAAAASMMPPSGGTWVPVDKDMLQAIDPRGRIHPPLTFKPRILRPFSMLTLIAVCVLMMVALIFTTVYSRRNRGLTPWPGSTYSGEYFVFRILPQLIAAFVLIYTQNIVTASMRVLPFATLAKEEPQERYLALFQRLYPKSFVLPQLSGPWQLKTFGMVTWLMNFIIPLHSAAFICIYRADEARWAWATNDGVVWVSVALYAILLVSSCVLMTFWFGHWTGLMWDIRSIADFIPLLNRTNTMSSYRRRGLHEHGGDYRGELRERWFDRLGYWQMDDPMTGGIWHTIGSSAMPASGQAVPGARQAERRSNELSVGSHLTGSSALLKYEGCSYIPWCLRTFPLVSYVLVTGGLLVALLIVSFLPQTRLEDGFKPLVAARPSQSSFSAANFLYSFVPALLGMIVFLLFQSPDQALRRLQAWGDLSQLDGAIASRSILADYAACLPFQASWRATRNGHWRVAAVSAMAVLFVFIPILGGGLFMALTAPSGEVRMYPSMPVLGVLLAFLTLYVACLCLIIPQRRQFRLPHAVVTIAHLIDLCTAKDLCEDAAFRSVRSRRDLTDRLGVGGHDTRQESVWFFGLSPGRDENRVSVRRMKRYTEKRTSSRPTTSRA